MHNKMISMFAKYFPIIILCILLSIMFYVVQFFFSGYSLLMRASISGLSTLLPLSISYLLTKWLIPYRSAILYWSISDEYIVCQLCLGVYHKLNSFLENNTENELKRNFCALEIETRDYGNAIHLLQYSYYWIYDLQDNLKYVFNYKYWMSESGQLYAWWDAENKQIVFSSGSFLKLNDVESHKDLSIYFESKGKYFALSRYPNTVEIFSNNSHLQKVISITHTDREFFNGLRLYSYNDTLYCIYTANYIFKEKSFINNKKDLVLHEVDLSKSEPVHSTKYLSEINNHRISNPVCEDVYLQRNLIFYLDKNTNHYFLRNKSISSLYVWDLNTNTKKRVSKYYLRPTVVKKYLLLDFAKNANIELLNMGNIKSLLI